MKINDHNIVTVLMGASTTLLLVLVIGSLLAGSPKLAIGILTGGILAMANFFWLANALTRVMQLPAASAQQFASIRYVLRLGVMGIIIYFLIVHAGINIFGLLLGLSVLVFSITALAFYTLTCKGGW